MSAIILPWKNDFEGDGAILDDLEWDVKSYLILGGAMHDAAITAWGIKGWYDYLRPISAIRYMAGLGQSSDPEQPSYHPGGIPLSPGLIELVMEGDTLAGENNEHLHKIKLYAWKGPDFIDDPSVDVAGVDWILAENWWPYQRPSFVTPPFAGYISGHSTYSRAAAEVLTRITGDPFFPGGMGEFEAPANQFLVFEDGPSIDIMLQWATYRDASDQTSLSRIWGGIHPPVDDIPGRLIGEVIGNEAFDYAVNFFTKDDDMDGYLSDVDCDDNNPAINPGVMEICDGIDNDCNGFIDDAIPIFTYYLDLDSDGFGDPAFSMDTCDTNIPSGYVANGMDCDDTNTAIHPDAEELCDEIDNNCNGLVDDAIPIYTYYRDADNDNFGDEAEQLDTCSTLPPAGFVTNNQDCDDSNDLVHPTMMELCDDIDNDCNTLIDDGLAIFTYFRDADADGFGNPVDSIETCLISAPEGYIDNSLDCDDSNAGINPVQEEVADNGTDEDCSGIDLFQLTKIFPNPARNSIEIHLALEGRILIEIIGSGGRLVQKTEVELINNQAFVDLTNLTSGLYFLRFCSNGWRRNPGRKASQTLTKILGGGVEQAFHPPRVIIYSISSIRITSEIVSFNSR